MASSTKKQEEEGDMTNNVGTDWGPVAREALKHPVKSGAMLMGLGVVDMGIGVVDFALGAVMPGIAAEGLGVATEALGVKRMKQFAHDYVPR
ncbi:MAG: hypothetical protein P4M15_04355 [Alphaproteobacteria bacterium]|nr:hypothetical protein [Alphaproteobacteria bacterium]